MKKKSTSQSAFFNLRVLIGLCVVLVGVFSPFVATAQEAWVAHYNGPGNSNDYALHVVVDASSNIYVTGVSTGSGTGPDYATIKYNSSGQQQWVARYNGPANAGDYASAIAIDGSGNVYVTGSSTGSGTGYDYATIKYNASGTQLWVDRYNAAGNGVDAGYAIAVDASGNAYATGETTSSAGDRDYATIKYYSCWPSCTTESRTNHVTLSRRGGISNHLYRARLGSRTGRINGKLAAKNLEKTLAGN
jgi:Beta-propeller repeat